MTTYTDSKGRKTTKKVFMHNKYNSFREGLCILEDLCMPLVIRAGDANEDTGYIGAYDEAWNKRVGEEKGE